MSIPSGLARGIHVDEVVQWNLEQLSLSVPRWEVASVIRVSV